MRLGDFDARMIFGRLAGWNHSMAVKVNDTVLGENTLNGSLRMLNRSVDQKFTKSLVEPLWKKNKKYNP